MTITTEKKIKLSRTVEKITKEENLVEQLKDLIVTFLDEEKAEKIIDINLHGKTQMADYLVVATGRGSKHIASMADKLADKLTKSGYGEITPEGDPKSNWILIDAYDVIIHLFTEEARDTYRLEELWNFTS